MKTKKLALALGFMGALAAGAAQANALGVNPTEINFGSVLIGNTATSSITLSGDSTEWVEQSAYFLSSGTALADPFALFPPGCTGTGYCWNLINPYVVPVNFSPTVLGNFQDYTVFSLASATGLIGEIQVRVSGVGVAVPEPATLALFGVGLAGIPLVRRRRTPT